MFLSRNKNNADPCKPLSYCIKLGCKGSNLCRHVFVMKYNLKPADVSQMLLDDWQTMEPLFRRCTMWRLFWVFTICSNLPVRTLGVYTVKSLMVLVKCHSQHQFSSRSKCPITCIYIITKTCLFRYSENFTTKNWKFSDKNWKFSDKNSDIFSYFCSKHRLRVLVRTALERRF